VVVPALQTLFLDRRESPPAADSAPPQPGT